MLLIQHKPQQCCTDLRGTPKRVIYRMANSSGSVVVFQLPIKLNNTIMSFCTPVSKHKLFDIHSSFIMFHFMASVKILRKEFIYNLTNLSQNQNLVAIFALKLHQIMVEALPYDCEYVTIQLVWPDFKTLIFTVLLGFQIRFLHPCNINNY